MYKLFVGTNSKNYNTAIGLGALIVRIRTEGVKLEPNAELYRKTITVSEAKEYAEGTKKAALFEYNGSADGIDQTAVQFWFTGMNTVHAKKDFPTKPGKYIVTASVVGGDYFAPPRDLHVQNSRRLTPLFRKPIYPHPP